MGTEVEIADLKEAFAMFDTDGNGTIEDKELREVMRSLGQNPTAGEVREMMLSVDVNRNGVIDFEEFLQVMKSRGLGYQDPEKELRDAFNFFDIDDSGSIDPDELKLLMLYLGQNVSENEIDAMMAIADEKGDVEISFEDFKVMWSKAKRREATGFVACKCAEHISSFQ